MRAHRLACPRCAEHYGRSQQFEQTLRACLRVPVPEGLAETVLLRQTTAQRKGGWRRPLRWLAVAASGVLAVGLVFTMWPRMTSEGDDRLVDLAMDHYLHEPYALDPRPVVPEPLLRTSASRVGLDLQHVPEAVTYAVACPMGDYRSLHLVVRRDDQPVTLFLVPGLDAPPRRFERDGVHSRALPVPGGTLLVMAEHADLVDPVAGAWAGVLSPSAQVAAGSH